MFHSFGLVPSVTRQVRIRHYCSIMHLTRLLQGRVEPLARLHLPALIHKDSAVTRVRGDDLSTAETEFLEELILTGNHFILYR
jgi:hypothetical protein